MQVTSIGVGNSSISLTYDKTNNKLTGNTMFSVTVYDIGDDPSTDFYVSYSVGEPFFIFNPEFGVNAPNPKKVIISIDDALFNLAVGNYTYNITFSSAFATDLNVPIYLNVIESADPGGGEPERDYKLKYYFENKIDSGDIFRCEIHMDQFVGNSIELEGTALYKYQNKTDHFHPIVASSLSISLLASIDQDLQDLYSEDEQTYKVYLKRNNQIIFVGFLKPDGINEDYVNDKWMLDIDVFDGLSTLKNIRFSNDNGILFSGKYSGLSILTTCLNKTGLDLPININCEVMYEVGPGSLSAFETFYLNANRYYQNNSDAMDCESVLKSILQLFNASLLQYNGEWYIYRPIDLDIPSVTFNKFEHNIYKGTFVIYPLVEIGSQINNFATFHFGANQKRSISPSVQAYRVIYEYGNVKSIYSNSELKLSGSGLDIPGWTVHNFDGEVERHPSGYGLISKTVDDSTGDPLLLTLNQNIDINKGAVIKLIIGFGNYKVSTYGLRFAIKIGDQFFNIDSGQWQNDGIINTVLNSSWDGYQYPGTGAKRLTGLGAATYELGVTASVSGKLTLSIYRDKHSVNGGFFDIYSVNVVPNDSGNIKGREYTAQRTKKISTVTKPNITLYNGDSVSDLFVGTIYKNDADTPTEKWKRVKDPNADSTGTQELLWLNAEDNLRIAPRPMVIFTGDVKGFIPFISYIKIDQHEGKKFQPTEYSFNTGTGVLKLTSREFENAYLQDGIDFRVNAKDNYGNEAKVTIV